MIMVCHFGIDNTCMGLITSLCSNLNHLISLMIPRITSNFSDLLSCGTINFFSFTSLTGMMPVPAKLRHH